MLYPARQGGSVPEWPTAFSANCILPTANFEFMLTDETRYKLFKLLEENPGMNQRELANELGISLGKTNYCLKALIEKGWVKAGNFRQNPHKLKYAYLLTPRGVEEKARVTLRFLKRKQEEYEQLLEELEELREEAAALKLAEEGEG